MRLDKRILQTLYTKRNDGEYHNLLKELNIEYQKIIGTVEGLLSNGLIKRPVKGNLGVFEDPDPDEGTLSKNVSCKITQAGILYHEKTIETRWTRIFSIIAILISVASLIMSIIK